MLKSMGQRLTSINRLKDIYGQEGLRRLRRAIDKVDEDRERAGRELDRYPTAS